MKQLYLLLFLVLICACTTPSTEKAVSKKVVTQIPVIESLLKELTKETPIEVISLANEDMTLKELAINTKGKEDLIDSLAPGVTAVVGLHSIIQDDGLYIAFRNRNIRITEIDLATSKNLTISSIGVLKKRQKVNPYIWLSISNLLQMSEIAYHDLIALFPDDSLKIGQNHEKLTKDLKNLKSSYEKEFLKLTRFEAATMIDNFDYFLQDINLFIMKRFPLETSWSKEDKASYEKALLSGSFQTIIHQWIPLSSVAKPAEEKNISFTVLNTGIPKMDNFDKGLVPFMEKNLQSLLKNLEKK